MKPSVYCLGEEVLPRLIVSVNHFLDTSGKNFITTRMSRKRSSLSIAISNLASTIPPMSPGDHCDHAPVEEPKSSCIIGVDPSFSDGQVVDTVDSLFKQWSLTPDGYRVRDSRIPSDPIRLGSILDDNARMAFIAGFKAANR